MCFFFLLKSRWHTMLQLPQVYNMVIQQLYKLCYFHKFIKSASLNTSFNKWRKHNLEKWVWSPRLLRSMRRVDYTTVISQDRWKRHFLSLQTDFYSHSQQYLNPKKRNVWWNEIPYIIELIQYLVHNRCSLKSSY